MIYCYPKTGCASHNSRVSKIDFATRIGIPTARKIFPPLTTPEAVKHSISSQKGHRMPISATVLQTFKHERVAGGWFEIRDRTKLKAHCRTR